MNNDVKSGFGYIIPFGAIVGFFTALILGEYLISIVIAMTILIKYSPRIRAVKKPTIAPKGIIYPNPDLTSLFITKLRFYLRITSKIDLFKH